MNGHNIYSEKIFLNYPQYPFLSGALISSVTGFMHSRIMTPYIQEYLSLNPIHENKSASVLICIAFIKLFESRFLFCTHLTICL